MTISLHLSGEMAENHGNINKESQSPGQDLNPVLLNQFAAVELTFLPQKNVTPLKILILEKLTAASLLNNFPDFHKTILSFP